MRELRQTDLIGALVRVWASGDGAASRIVGTGILVSPRHVLTCAHVVAEALKQAQAGLGSSVTVDFPASAPQRMIQGKVVIWHPREPKPGGLYDIAGLELPFDVTQTLPHEVTPVPLVLLDNMWNQPCRVFGFPAGRPDGNYAEGQLKDVLANGWVMIRGGADAREFTRPGYSGGPVYTSEGVVGMLTEGDRDQRVKEAVMIPVAVLLEAWPALHALNSTCPYQGLSSFTEKTSRFFLGREHVTQNLAKAVRAPPRFRVLAGASGSGKSSVIFAGVIPHLRRAALDEKAERWCVAAFSPGAAPFEALSRALVPHYAPERRGAARLEESKRLSGSLLSGTLGLSDVAADIVRQQPASQLLLVVDQVEELFTQTPTERKRDITKPNPESSKVQRALSERLLTELLSLQEHPETTGRVSVLLAIRTDFLDKLLEHAPLTALEHQHGVIHYLGPVSDLREVIEGPLREVGIGKLEPGLSERILGDVAGEANPLPLLEFTLTELWRAQQGGLLTHAAYNALGGVHRALATYAQTTFENLSPEEKKQAKEVFIQLAQPSEGLRVTRRVAPLSDLGDSRALVTKLASKHLIVTGRHPDNPDTAEVAHEALFEHWPLLMAWVQESWAFRKWQEGLRAELHDWLEHGEDPTFLLQGARLVAAESYLGEHHDHLSGQERDYITRSAERRDARAREEVARLEREARLQKRVNRGLSAFLLIALLLSGAALWQWHEARQAQAAASGLNAELGEALLRSEAHARRALATQLGAQGLLATQNPGATNGDARLGALLAAHAVRVEDGLQSRGNLLRVVQSDLTLPSFAPPELTLSPDGATLAVAAHHFMSLWDAATHDRLSEPQVGHAGAVSSMSFNADGSFLATGSTDRGVRLWDATTGMPQGDALRALDLQVWHLTFSPDDAFLLAGSPDGELVIWDLESQDITARLERRSLTASEPAAAPAGLTVRRQAEVAPELEHLAWVRSVAFSPDAQVLAVAGWDGVVQLLELPSLTPRGALEGASYQARSVAFSPDGRTLAVGGRDGSVTLWDAVTLEPTAEALAGLQSMVRAVAFGSDGGALAAADAHGHLVVWDLASGNALPGNSQLGADTVTELSFEGETLHVLGHEGSRAALWRLMVSEGTLELQGSVRLTRALDNTVDVWDVANRQALSTPLVRSDDRLAAQLLFSPDGRVLAARSNNLEVQLWDVSAQQPIGGPLEGHVNGVEAMAFSPSGEVLLTGGRDGTLVVRGGETGIPLRDAISTEYRALALAYHPDGRRVALGTERQVLIYDADTWAVTGEVAWDTPIRQEYIWALSYSPDGRHLAGGYAEQIYVWDSESLSMTGDPLPGALGESKVRRLAFSPDSSMLISIYEGNYVVLWNLESGQPTVLAHSTSAAYSPDGTMLMTGAPAGSLVLLDAQSLEPASELEGVHATHVDIMTFSPEGGLVASSGLDGSIILTQVSVERWLTHACARAERNLNAEEWRRYLSDAHYHKTCESYPVDASAILLLVEQAQDTAQEDASVAHTLFARASRWAAELEEEDLITHVCRVAADHGFVISAEARCAEAEGPEEAERASLQP